MPFQVAADQVAEGTAHEVRCFQFSGDLVVEYYAPHFEEADQD